MILLFLLLFFSGLLRLSLLIPFALFLPLFFLLENKSAWRVKMLIAPVGCPESPLGSFSLQQL